MKSLLLLLSACFIYASHSYGQILYSNTFDNGLNGMTILDMDGNTPHPNVSEFDGSWSGIPSTRFEEYADAAAISGSFYSPSGESDDWLITPAINIPAGALLTWDALSLDDSFRDSYEIRVSTTGTEVEDFNDILLKVDAEENVLTTRSVVLNDYVGQSIYIAFRNVSSDKFLLILDNIFVRLPYERDVFVKSMDLNLNYVPSQDKYITLSENKTVKANLLNFGSKRITNMIVSYTLNGQKFEETITGNLDVGEVLTYESNPITFNVGNGQVLDIDVTSINGQSDENVSNNKQKVTFDALPYVTGYSGSDSKGRNVNIYTLLNSGKSVFLYFFSSDCDDCEDAVQKLNQYYLSQGAGGQDFEMIGISVNPEDDDAKLNNLGWSATFPLLSYIPYNDKSYLHYAKNHGLSPDATLPFFVQLCPGSNPAFSSINASAVGYDGSDIFNESFRPAHEVCQGSLSTLESIEFLEDISVFPNPINQGLLQLEIVSVESANLNLNISNLMGQTVKNIKSQRVSTGKNEITADISDLENGIYYLNISSGNQLNTIKIAVIN